MLLLYLLGSMLWAVMGGSPAREAAQTIMPRFEPAPCPFLDYQIPASERIDCGYLVVPENQARPDSGMIRLAVAIIHAHTMQPAPDPIVFLSGGPGYGALDNVEYWVDYATPLLERRDIILIDQRGTGYSQPSLACNEFRELVRDTEARRLSVEESITLDVQAALRCRERLIGAGIDLQAYTTAANASDISALRQALGYQSWNLYGLSYGSRLALAVLRDHPEGLRSAVLDSALPPQAGWWEERAGATERVFRTLFDGCAADAACSAAYPALERDFDELVARLDTAPLTVDVLDMESGTTRPQLIDGGDIIAGGFDALYDTAIIAYLPLAITEIHAGNTGVIAGLASGLVGDPAISNSGMWYSIECSDEAPFNDTERVRQNAATYPRWRDFVLQDATPAVCEYWGVMAAGAIETAPVHSDVPALLLHGEYDPIHPPSWGRLAASTLSRSFYYELPGMGHGVSFDGCGQELVVAFLEAPAQAPDSSCITAMRGPDFVTELHRNRGVFQVALALQRPSLAITTFAGTCILLLLCALLGWPLGYIIARRRGREQPRLDRIVRALAAIVAALNLVFVSLLLFEIVRASEETPYLLLFGLPSATAPLFYLPWLTAALSVGLAGCVIRAWHPWSILMRATYAVVALACFGFIGLIWYLQIL